VKKNQLLLFLILLIATAFPHTALPQTDVYLKVYKRTFQRMNLALHPFTSKNNGGEADMIRGLIGAVLKNDLWMSGYFNVELQLVASPVNGASSSGTDNFFAAIHGSFAIAENLVSIEPQVIDKASGSVIHRSNYKQPVGNERSAIHKIADDIVYTLTGESGFANSKVAYVQETKNGWKEIAVMDYDGSNINVVTQDKSINLSPVWSPDGRKLCYTSYKNDNPDLYILNLTTGQEVKISDVNGLNTAPAWSPDGSRIAMTLTKDGNAEIYTVHVDRKFTQRLTYSRAINSSPTWSPSNREIAFTSDRSGMPQVYIMDSDGLNIRRLTFEGSYNDSPAWSPRGDKIAFVSRTDSGFDIYTIDVNGENMMRLTDSSRSNEDPTWSPNGFSLIFSSNRNGKKQLYSMFWDGAAQKKLTEININYLPSWSVR